MARSSCTARSAALRSATATRAVSMHAAITGDDTGITGTTKNDRPFLALYSSLSAWHSLPASLPAHTTWPSTSRSSRPARLLPMRTAFESCVDACNQCVAYCNTRGCTASQKFVCGGAGPGRRFVLKVSGRGSVSCGDSQPPCLRICSRLSQCGVLLHEKPLKTKKFISEYLS